MNVQSLVEITPRALIALGKYGINPVSRRAGNGDPGFEGLSIPEQHAQGFVYTVGCPAQMHRLDLKMVKYGRPTR